jgi:DNA-binding CsgD family transcriptional regulator
VQQVGVIVLELTKGRELEAALFRLTDKLTLVSASLRDHRAAQPSPPAEACANVEDVFMSSATLLQSCLSEARAISKLLHASPQLPTVQPLDARLPDTTLLPSGQRQDFVHTGPAECVDPLSAREREVAALLAQGKTNKQIGSILTISTRTVESHRAKIMLKLDLHSLSDIVRYALRCNLVQP